MISHFGKFSNPQTETLPIGQQIKNLFGGNGFWYDFGFFLSANSVDIFKNGLTLVNAPVRDSLDGRPANGCSVHVAASAQYYTAADDPSIDANPNGYTCFGWANIAAAPAIFRTIYSKGNVSTPASHEYTLFHDSTSRYQFRAGNGVAVALVSFPTIFAPGTWDFVAAQCLPAQGIIRISVNRAAWVNAAYTGLPIDSINLLYVGSDLSARHMDGRLDGLGYCPAILSDPMLDYIYNAGAGRTYSDL